MKLRITDRARADIRALFQLIQTYDQKAALQFIQRLDTGFQTLTEYPASGMECPEFGAGIRRKTIGLTIVFYKVDQNEMIILRAIDGRMDLESVFREQPK